MEWGMSVFCTGEFVRTATHRPVPNPPSMLAQALSFLEKIHAYPTSRIVRPGPEFVDCFADTTLAASTRGNLVFHVQIAAIRREHGISTILPNDRDFRRFDHLRVRFSGEPA